MHANKKIIGYLLHKDNLINSPIRRPMKKQTCLYLPCDASNFHKMIPFESIFRSVMFATVFVFRPLGNQEGFRYHITRKALGNKEGKGTWKVQETRKKI